MKLTITLFSILLYSFANAQDVKFVQKQYNEVFEEYYVLQSNKKVKHGQYTKYLVTQLDNGNLLLTKRKILLVETGNYSYGKKNGVWTNYFDNNIISIYNYQRDSLNGEFFEFWSDSISTKSKSTYSDQRESEDESLLINVEKELLPIKVHGFFKDNRECSIWSYYSLQKELYFQYDFDNRIIIKDSYNNYENIQLDTIREIRSPIFLPGGYTELKNFFKSVLTSLPFTQNTNVTVKLQVNSDGRVSSCEFINIPFSKRRTRKINESFEPTGKLFIPKRENKKSIDSKIILEYKVLVNDNDVKVSNTNIIIN